MTPLGTLPVFCEVARLAASPAVAVAVAVRPEALWLVADTKSLQVFQSQC